MTLKEGDRVHDNEGDHGTVVGVYEDGSVLVDGDAGTQPWRYLARELTKDNE